MRIRIVILFSILLAAKTAALASCQHCHRDTKFSEVWERSTHGKKGVDCLACHVEENIFKDFLHKLYGLATFSFEKTHLGGYPKDENCSKCHRAIRLFNYVAKDALPEKLKDIGMTINHQKHIELRDSCMACHSKANLPKNPAFKFIRAKDPMGCIGCHNNMVHTSPGKYDTNYPTEEQCGYCHGKNRKCPSLQKISDIKDKGRCTECHPNQYSL